VELDRFSEYHIPVESKTNTTTLVG